MRKMWPILLLMPAACGSGSGSIADGNNVLVANDPMTKTKPAPACALPRLEFRYTELKPDEQATLTSNFRTAFDRACAEGLITEPLVDPRSINKNSIVVMNAPEANITSIYFGPSAAPPAMLMESPLGSPPRIPSAEDFHEAIYCATKGATPQEEEETGRCLPD